MTSDVLDILELDEGGPRKSLLDTKALLNRNEKVTLSFHFTIFAEENGAKISSSETSRSYSKGGLGPAKYF